MKILHQEMELREETRGLQQARPALAAEPVTNQSEVLAETQQDLAARVNQVNLDIRELPDAENAFRRELILLTQVRQVMLEAHELLRQEITGPETIAAETEAIELLLQSRRINPKGGGGGGGSSPGGGGTGDTDEAALALIGLGNERNASVIARTVRQSTGTSGSALPAEFRQGLESFFEALEQHVSRNPR